MKSFYSTNQKEVLNEEQLKVNTNNASKGDPKAALRVGCHYQALSISVDNKAIKISDAEKLAIAYYKQAHKNAVACKNNTYKEKAEACLKTLGKTVQGSPIMNASQDWHKLPPLSP